MLKGEVPVRLSIVIPTSNKATYIDMVLMSIEKNLNIDNIELLIIDDGSVDNTSEVVLEHKKYLNINYLYQSKAGLSAARNKGIVNANAEYILFLDDDRVVEKNYFSHTEFESFSDITIGRRKEIFYCDFVNRSELFKDALLNDFETEKKKIKNERYYLKTLPLSFINECAIPWVGCTFSNTLIKKNVFRKVGLFDENFIGWGFEDLEFAYRSYCSGCSFSWNKTMSSIHIYHSHSTGLLEQRAMNYLMFLKKYEKYEIKLYREFMENRIDVCAYNEIIKNFNKNSRK